MHPFIELILRVKELYLRNFMANSFIIKFILKNYWMRMRLHIKLSDLNPFNQIEIMLLSIFYDYILDWNHGGIMNHIKPHKNLWPLKVIKNVSYKKFLFLILAPRPLTVNQWVGIIVKNLRSLSRAVRVITLRFSEQKTFHVPKSLPHCWIYREWTEEIFDGTNSHGWKSPWQFHGTAGWGACRRRLRF